MKTKNETPRTDAECGGPISGDDTWPSCYVRADFARELEIENNRLTEELDRLKKDHEDDASELCQIEDALGFRDQFVAEGKDGKLVGVHQAALEKIRDMVASLGELEDSRNEWKDCAKALSDMLRDAKTRYPSLARSLLAAFDELSSKS